MKRLLMLLVCGLFAFVLIGCQDSARNKRAVEVIIEGGGDFPEFLVGRWKGDKHGWEFVFEPDGMISSAVISMGRKRIIPGETKVVPLKLGGKGIYQPGLWTVQYSPLTRELAVLVVMDYVHLEMGPNLLEGKSTDTLVGKVSEDGKSWHAEWFSLPDYIAYTPEPKRLTVDPNASFAATIIFEKLEEPK